MIKVRCARSLARGHGATQQRGGIAGQSVTATLKLFQERGETFRDRLVDSIVPGPKPLPDFPQPWHFGQHATTFGLARPTLPALPTTD